jgi:hypothetical protein
MKPEIPNLAQPESKRAQEKPRNTRNTRKEITGRRVGRRDSQQCFGKQDFSLSRILRISRFIRLKPFWVRFQKDEAKPENNLAFINSDLEFGLCF